MAWSTVAGVVRPPRVVIIRGDESEVQRRKWRGPRALCFAVATAWQSTRDPVSVVSLHQVEGGVAAARRRWSRIAVVFPVRCGLHLSVPYRRMVTLGGSRLLHKCG